MQNTGDLAAIENLYDALNRGEISSFMSAFDANAVRVEFEGTPTGGRFEGRAAIEGNFNSGRSNWAEGFCKPESILANGDRYVALVHVHVKLKSTMNWVEGHIADGFVFKNAKITEFRSFMERADALKWAGL